MDPITQKRRRCYAFLGLGGLLAAIGLFLVPVAIYRIAQAMQSSNWPTAPGVIRQSEYITVLVPRQRKGSLQEHVLQMSYDYEVNGQQYTGTRRTMMSATTLSEQTARDIVAKYPVGSNVKVYYNPSNPSHCCLETGLMTLHWALLLSGIAGFALGGGIMWFARKVLKKIPNAA
jgi:hypothetical protein